MNCDYNVISTGSDGNAVILNGSILIDCGVPYKDLKPYAKDLKIVFLTHIHGDHFNSATVRRLAAERPTLRFAGGDWMVKASVDAGVNPRNFDVVDPKRRYYYGSFAVEPFALSHDVPNCGYKIFFPQASVFYATDTRNLNGIEAKDYDLYLVEANYGEEEIHDRIKQKAIDGVYAYERRAMHTHMSKEKCDEWIYSNAGPNSRYVYLHQHQEKEGDLPA